MKSLNRPEPRAIEDDSHAMNIDEEGAGIGERSGAIAEEDDAGNEGDDAAHGGSRSISRYISTLPRRLVPCSADKHSLTVIVTSLAKTQAESS